MLCEFYVKKIKNIGKYVLFFGYSCTEICGQPGYSISLPVKIILIDTTAINILVHISFQAGVFISVGQLSRSRYLEQSVFCTFT